MKGQILFIDDNELDVKIAGLALGKIEYECVGFTDYRKGLEWATENVPLMVLLDVQIPGTTGYKLIPQLRAKPGYEKIPILIVSGKAQAEDIRMAIKAGSVDYIIKPIDPMILQEKVQRVQSKSSTNAAEVLVPEGFMSNSHFVHHVQVAGLSEFGVHIVSSAPMHPDDTIELGGLLEAQLGVSQVWLRCVSCEKRAGSNEYMMMFTFIGLSERERQVIRRTCRQIFVQSKAEKMGG